MKFQLINHKKRISIEKHLKKSQLYIYIKRKMDYTDSNTYTIQAKYIKKIYELKLNEIDYLNQIKELCKLLKVYESVFDQEDVLNVRRDISILEGKLSEDKKLIKQYSDLIEHIEILCQCGGIIDTKYFDVKPKNAVKWMNKSIQYFEEEYSELVKPK